MWSLIPRNSLIEQSVLNANCSLIVTGGLFVAKKVSLNWLIVSGG